MGHVSEYEITEKVIGFKINAESVSHVTQLPQYQWRINYPIIVYHICLELVVFSERGGRGDLSSFANEIIESSNFST